MATTTKTEGPRKLRKGERTREALKASALALLMRDGFHGMKVTDICQLAGIAAGTFYIYFPDKTELSLEVVKEKLAENERYIFGGEPQEDAWDAIVQTNKRYVETFVEAGPLNRVLAQMIDAFPEMRQHWERSLARVARVIARGLQRRTDAPEGSERALLFVAHAAQGMSDAMALQYFAWENEDVRTASGTPEELTERLSVLWFRMLYGTDPSPDRIEHARDILTLTQSERSDP